MSNKVTLEIHDDILESLNKIKDLSATDIEVDVPEGSLLFDNAVNLKILKRLAKDHQKNISFKTNDQFGINILQELGDATTIDDGDFITKSSNLDDANAEEENFDESLDNNETEDDIDPETKKYNQMTTLLDTGKSSFGASASVRGQSTSDFNEQGMQTKSSKFSLFSKKSKNSENDAADQFDSEDSSDFGDGIFDETPKKRKKIKLGFLLPIIILLILAGLGAGVYAAVTTLPTATVSVSVSSDPLTKSVSLKVKENSETSAVDRILKGEVIEASVTESIEVETTGEQTTGDKAKGKIKIYNRTDEEVSFSDGDIVTYKSDDGDLNFVLLDDVDVDAESLEDPADITSPTIPGEATVEVEAVEIGSNYNVDEDETFEFEDYKRSEVFAQSDEDFDGGSSRTVAVVSEEDITKAKEELTTKLEEEAPKSLRSRVKLGTKLIEGSQTLNVLQESVDGQIGDEQDTVKVEQIVSVSGLIYSQEELDTLVDSLVQEFVPQNFELSDEEREVNVEVLGDSETTVLSSSEADLQVTLKTFVIPAINEEELIKTLTGVTLTEAERILGGIRNVNSYNLELEKSIPLWNRTPVKSENIEFELIREN